MCPEEAGGSEKSGRLLYLGGRESYAHTNITTTDFTHTDTDTHTIDMIHCRRERQRERARERGGERKETGCEINRVIGNMRDHERSPIVLGRDKTTDQIGSSF